MAMTGLSKSPAPVTYCQHVCSSVKAPGTKRSFQLVSLIFLYEKCLSFEAENVTVLQFLRLQLELVTLLNSVVIYFPVCQLGIKRT